MREKIEGIEDWLERLKEVDSLQFSVYSLQFSVYSLVIRDHRFSIVDYRLSICVNILPTS